MSDYASELAAGEVTAGQALMLAKQQRVRPGRRDRRLLDQGLGRGDLLRAADVPRWAADGGEGESVLPPEPLPATDPNDPTTRSSTPFSVDLRERLNQVDRRARHLLASRRAGAAGRPAPPDPAEADRGRHLDEGPAHGFVLESLTTADAAGVEPGDRAGDDRPRRERARARVGRAVLPGDRGDGRAAGDGRGPARHPQPDGGLVPRRRPAPQPRDGRPRPALDLRRLRAADDPPGRRPGRERRLLDPGRGRGRRPPRRHRDVRDRRRPGGRRRGRVAPLRPLADRAGRPVDRRRPALGHHDPRGDRPGLRPLLQRRLLEQEGRGPHVLAGADFGRGRPAGGLQPGHARRPATTRRRPRSRSTRATTPTRPSRSRSTAASSSRSRARSPPASRPRASTWSSSAAPTTRPRSRGMRSTARARRSSPRPTAPRARTAGTTDRSPSASPAATRSSGVPDCPDPVTLSERRRATSRSPATATDRAGNSSSVTVDGINIDLAARRRSPRTCSAQPNQFGWYNAAGVTIRFTCTRRALGLVALRRLGPDRSAEERDRRDRP